MSSLLTRFLLFVALLLAGFSFGWEFLLAAFFTLIAIGRAYWEHILIGFIFDIIFEFPQGFFIIIFSTILITALLADDYFKSDSIFSRAVRGVSAVFSGAFILFIFFMYSVWPEITLASAVSAVSFVKMTMILVVALLLLHLIQQKVAAKKIF